VSCQLIRRWREAARLAGIPVAQSGLKRKRGEIDAETSNG
jgi:hypothetical protein